ncbi:MAG: DUF5606 domain-containing protein [Dysgonamonadaceae bacterium]|jgi:hypothetical protein|nr:DUF5606 domain-containing protein [Dysgonamonadaceae bacterium]
MLKKILCISGKPGLFKLISQGKNMHVVESLIDAKRIPVYSQDKVISLSDIAIYTSSEEVPLTDILTIIKEKESGQKIDIKLFAQPESLKKYFLEILPEFDKDRVYPSDIKKILNWYNILMDAGITKFKEEKNQEN